jgi:hypothetical protein
MHGGWSFAGQKETSRPGEVSIELFAVTPRRRLPIVPVRDPVPLPDVASAPTLPSASLSSAPISSISSVSSISSLASLTPPVTGVRLIAGRGQCKSRDSSNTEDVCPDKTNPIDHDQSYGRTCRDYPAPQASSQRTHGLRDFSGPSEDHVFHLIAFPSVT